MGNKEQEPESEGQQEPGEKENGVSIIFTPPQKKSAALKQSSKPFKFVESRDILADREKKDEQEKPENKEQEPESEGQQEPGEKENGVSIIFTPPQKKSAALKQSSKPFKFVESRGVDSDILGDYAARKKNQQEVSEAVDAEQERRIAENESYEAGIKKERKITQRRASDLADDEQKRRILEAISANDGVEEERIAQQNKASGLADDEQKRRVEEHEAANNQVEEERTVQQNKASELADDEQKRRVE